MNPVLYWIHAFSFDLNPFVIEVIKILCEFFLKIFGPQ